MALPPNYDPLPSPPRPGIPTITIRSRRAYTISAIGAAIRATMVPAALACPILIQAAAWGQATPPPTSAASPGPSAPVSPGPAARSATQSYEGLPIRRVDVVGNTRTDTRLILDQVRSQPGQRYSEALVNVDNRAIAALDRFVTVVPLVIPVEDPGTHQITGVDLQFVVEERALVTAVEVTGNRKFPESQIREGLLVHAGAAADPFRIESDRKFILDLYHKQGYSETTVTVDPALVTNKGIVRYQITEGPASQIKSIVIEGNANLSSSYIKWRLETKTYFWIFRKGLLDDEKLQQDLITIRQLYLKKAYLDARVSYALDYSEDKRNLTVRFIVIEGPRYKIGQINLMGNKVFGNAELLGDTTRFGPGSYAEEDHIDALQKRIEDAYGHQGYIHSFVEIAKPYTEVPGVVDLNITITEGTPFLVGRIIVRGNETIQDRVIRRQIRIYPDQTFDTVLVRKSIERLKAASIFKDVKVTSVNSPGNPAGVNDALVEVAEGETGKFSAGAGISTNSGVVGQFSVEQQNFDITNPPHSWGELFRGQAFKGAGQYFQVLLEPGTEFQRYSVSFEEPYLFDSPYSFRNDLYYFTRARESWDETRVGNIVTFGRRFGDVWSLSLSLRAEDVGISHPVDYAEDRITQNHFPIIGPNGGVTFANDTTQEILNQVGDHFLTSIKPAVVRDTTDSRSFPTEGTRASFSVEQYGAMGGDIVMTKFNLGFNWYTPLYTDLFDRKTVFSLRNQVGLIPFGDSPFYERYYLGGIGDLRGFKFRGVSPRSGPLNDPVGGDFSWVTTAEVNYPIYEELLRGVVFTDIGTVESDITIGEIRSDVGAGVRITLPFFGGLPLALDFAYPTTKEATDLTQLISVALGASF